jgi:glycosyltransferase involved in cell wall biosynthesis
LKVLLLNYADSGGGAAIAAFRLFKALRKYGYEADFGVVDKKSADVSILSFKKKSIHRSCIVIQLFNKLFKKTTACLETMLGIDFRTSNPILHSENKKTSIDIDYINNSNYDLIHLHWINHDMISIEDIRKIKKPIVWTMHDSWVFCGAEHHPNIVENDKRFITGYTRTNKPKTTVGIDICRKIWERKKKMWENCRFNFISPSNFEKKLLGESALFRDAVCEVIPNIMPKSIFRPIDKRIIKDMYQIPMHKKIIGFGSVYNIWNKKSIKGEYLLFNALQMIDKTDNYYCIIMGDTDSSFIDKIKIPVFVTGFINNPYILATIYNACDVFVCPSIVENLPNVCLEALFSGTPVAAFRTGGIPDIVEHKITGYLVEPFDTDDLYRGILYCIDNYAELSRNSLRKAATDFNAETIIEKHIELYKRIMTADENTPS